MELCQCLCTPSVDVNVTTGQDNRRKRIFSIEAAQAVRHQHVDDQRDPVRLQTPNVE